MNRNRRQMLPLKGERRAQARGLRVMPLAASVGLLALAACQPTAFVEINNTSLERLHSSGVLFCGDEANVEADLRFTAVTNANDGVIVPDGNVGAFLLQIDGPNANFGVDDVEILDGNKVLYPSPDVPCTSNEDCLNAGLPERFTCNPRSLTGQLGQSLAGDLCGTNVAVAIDGARPLTFNPADDPQGDRDFAVVFTGSGSTYGISPESSSGFEQAHATDPQRKAVLGLNFLLAELSNPEEGQPFHRASRVAFGVYGDTEVTWCDTDCGIGEGDYFIERLTQTSAYDTFRSRIGPFYQGQGLTEIYSNYWLGIDGAQQALGSVAGDNNEQHIVLFVDQGLYPETLRAEVANLYRTPVETAFANNPYMHLHVIHLDVDRPSVLADPEGRIEDLAELACLSGGTYTYLQDADSLSEAFRNVAFHGLGAFEVGVNLSNYQDLPYGSYTLGATLVATINGESAQYTYSAAANASVGSVDTRISIQHSGTCASDDDCLGALVCGATSVCEAP